MFWVQAGQMGAVIEKVTEWFEEFVAWLLASFAEKLLGV